MRLATLKQDSWQLRSGEEAHARDPNRFRIPTLAERSAVKPGQAVKLIFDIECTDQNRQIQMQGERMWVIVAQVIGDAYVGILDNQPTCVERSDDVYLCFGAEVPFRAEHVIDIAQPPADYVNWQLGQEPERRWPRG